MRSSKCARPVASGCSQGTAARGLREEGGHPRGSDLRRGGEAPRRARDRARRAERRPKWHACGEETGPRLRRALEAVASEGHGPRTRGHDARAALDRRRRRVPAHAAQLRGEGESQGAPFGAARSALGSRGPGDVRRPRRLRLLGAVDTKGDGAARGLGPGPSARRRRGRRGAERDEVVPQPRARRRRDSVRARGGRARVGALRARHGGRARSGPGEGLMSLHPNEVLLAPVVSEKSYAQIEGSNTYSFRIHPDAHKPQVRQAVEELFEVSVLRVNISKVKPKPKRRGLHKGTRPGGKKAIGRLRPGKTSDIWRGAQVYCPFGGKSRRPPAAA